MMRSITALTTSGLKDWYIQRASAIILAVYVLFVTGYLLGHSDLDYVSWKTLFSSEWMRVFTFVAVVSMALHAWIGMWTVFTDYIHHTLLRSLIQSVTILALLAYVVWAAAILWS